MKKTKNKEGVIIELSKKEFWILIVEIAVAYFAASIQILSSLIPVFNDRKDIFFILNIVIAIIAFIRVRQYIK